MHQDVDERSRQGWILTVIVERRGQAKVAASPGPTNPVHVLVDFGRQVIVHDLLDLWKTTKLGTEVPHSPALLT